MAAGGKPVEIMGMMLGRPDTEAPNALIVTDVSLCRTGGSNEVLFHLCRE